LFRNNLKKDVFWLTVSEVSDHNAGEGMIEQSSSHHHGQKAETGKYKKDLLPQIRPQLLVFTTS
jgi:hypothetical protein